MVRHGLNSCVALALVTLGFSSFGETAFAQVASPLLPSVTTVDSAGIVGEFPSITVGADGHALIAYRDETNLNLKVAYCWDPACRFRTISVLDSVGDVGAASAAAIGSDGLPVLSYFDVTHGSLKVAHCANPYCTSAALAIVDASDNAGLRSDIAIGSDGLPLITYTAGQHNHLRVAHCENLDCTSAAIAEFSFTGEHQSVAIGRNGFPIIAHFNVGATPQDNELRLVYCLNVVCSASTLAPVTPVRSFAWYVSLAIGSDGLPLVSFIDDDFDVIRGGDYEKLKVAHCEDALCEHSTVSDLGSARGGLTSIAKGRDGLPVISYAVGSNLDADLKVAHCQDVACSSAAISTVDAAGRVGTLSALALGSDGFPVIAYLDGTNENLKFAHCHTYSCGVAHITATDGHDRTANDANPVVTWPIGAPLMLRIGVDSGAAGAIISQARVSIGVAAPNRTLWLTPAGWIPSKTPIYVGPLATFDEVPIFTLADSSIVSAGSYLWILLVESGSDIYGSAVVTTFAGPSRQ